MKTPTKGLLFDRENSQMSEIKIRDYKDVQDALFMTTHDRHTVTLTAVTFELNGASVVAYVDDEGLLKSKPLTAVVGFPQPLAGNIVFVGDLDDRCDHTDIPMEAFEGIAKDGLPYVVSIDGFVSAESSIFSYR